MKKTLTYLFALGLLVAVSACTDQHAEEIYKLSNENISNMAGTDKSHSEVDNPPPAP
ncbi:lipoprotein [Fulvivirga kasyanovii]|uniref:lipoprotein n=1 Tax=Fulvivirga kasyanovii TaxID=396812 RepID=UPI0016286F11|nr:lipoprotein [Fulvivirga kasyanovii]